MTSLVEDYENILNDIYLMYSDEIVKNRKLKVNVLILRNREMFNSTKEITTL